MPGGDGFWQPLPGAGSVATAETVFPPTYSVVDGSTLTISTTYVWGVDANGDPYYNAAGVTPGDEAVLVLDANGDPYLRPVEV